VPVNAEHGKKKVVAGFLVVADKVVREGRGLWGVSAMPTVVECGGRRSDLIVFSLLPKLFSIKFDDCLITEI